jgi:hypothetical protein
MAIYKRGIHEFPEASTLTALDAFVVDQPNVPNLANGQLGVTRKATLDHVKTFIETNSLTKKTPSSITDDIELFVKNTNYSFENWFTTVISKINGLINKNTSKSVNFATVFTIDTVGIKMSSAKIMQYGNVLVFHVCIAGDESYTITANTPIDLCYFNPGYDITWSGVCFATNIRNSNAVTATCYTNVIDNKLYIRYKSTSDITLTGNVDLRISGTIILP